MGDSVMFDTPVYVRDKKNHYIDIVAISDLYNGQKVIAENRIQATYKKNRRSEILTHEGWRDIKTVFLKKNKLKKPICVTHVSNGIIKSTYDHCLFVGGQEKAANELAVGDKLDVFRPEISMKTVEFVNDEIAWLLGQWVSDGAIFDSNYFMLADTNIEIINKLRSIIDKYFLTRTEVKTKEYFDGIRKPIHILTSTRCNELDVLIKSCISKNSKVKKIPQSVLNAPNNVRMAFLQGFRDGDGTKVKDQYRYFNKSMPVIAGLQYLTRCVGIDTGITIYKGKPELLNLCERKSSMVDDGVIKSFTEIGAPEFLYDIETDAGTFVSALGDIVIHNSKMGLHARLMSQACRKLVSAIGKTETVCIFINQFRSKIGVIYGDPRVPTGGNALKYYASVRVEMSSVGKIEKDGVQVGNRTKVKVTKNKCAPPYKVAEFDILYGEGIDSVGEVLDLSAAQGVVQKRGSHYYYGETKLGSSRDSARKLLCDNNELVLEIRGKLV